MPLSSSTSRRSLGRALSILSIAMVIGVAGACGGDADTEISTAARPLADPTVFPDDVSPTDESANDLAGSSAPANADGTTAAPTAVATTAPVLAPTPTVFARPAAPNGQVAPAVATSAAGLAGQVEQAEIILAAAASGTAEQLSAAGHAHQVAIRKLGYEPDWDNEFFQALPAEWHARTLLHLEARRALIDLSSGYDAADFIPAWEIIDPEPMGNLLSYYQAAENATGIEWEYLAAINLIETGMGRIRGLSSAGAQGPMQFLPTTWDESGIGEGDINDPSDAINAAARYLVRRGGPSDMEGALWGYNNHDLYVAAVQAYAELLRQDAGAYAAIYNWEIYFYTEAGDIWLPAGYRSEERVDLVDYLAANPWSAPDPGIR